MAFKIKQHDLQPNLPVEFFQSDGVTPLPLDDATEVNFVLREKGANPDDPPLIKTPITLTDVPGGVGYYDWETGDTDTVGTFEYEFEIVWTNGDPQTIPVDSYFELVVIEDIG